MNTETQFCIGLKKIIGMWDGKLSAKHVTSMITFYIFREKSKNEVISKFMAKNACTGNYTCPVGSDITWEGTETTPEGVKKPITGFHLICPGGSCCGKPPGGNSSCSRPSGGSSSGSKPSSGSSSNGNPSGGAPQTIHVSLS